MAEFGVQPGWTRTEQRARVGQCLPSPAGGWARLRPGRLAVQNRLVAGKLIGQERDARTYMGVGPHPGDPRAAEVAAEVSS
jgi:hypothetical protein